MDKRSFLMTGASAGLGGCVGRGDSRRHRDSTSESPTPSPTRRTPSSTPSTPDPREGVFDDVEDLSRRETVGGTVTADGERCHTGTQPARIETSTDDKRGVTDRQFDRPVDLAEYLFAMARRPDSLVYPRLQAFDEDGDRVDFRRQVYPNIPFQLYDFGIQTIDGSPDLSAVSKLRVQQYTGETST